MSSPEASAGDHRVAGEGRSRPVLRQLPPARLAALPPALLGLPDPGRLLRRLRDRPRPGGPAPGAAPRRRGLRPEGQEPARQRRGLGRHRVPAVRRARPPGDRHHGHLRRLLLVLPALLRRPQRRGRLGPRGGAQLDARRPVHRRRRARDPAPDVRALLRQGARRHEPARRAGALRGPVHDRDDHPRRARRCRARRATWSIPPSTSSATAPTPPAATCSSSAPRTRTPTGPTRASRASTASWRGSGG